MPLFADVILPLPLSSNYTYSIPKEYEERISVGCRVTVPLGKSKHYTALVAKVHDEEPQGYETRPITELLDDSAIVLPVQMRLWEWIARYYVCSLGEIFKAAVPQGLKGEFKPKTEQRIRLTKRVQDTIAKNLIEQSLSRAPRQKRLFNTFLQLTQNDEEVSRHKLIEIAEVTPNICKELIDKGIFECYEVEIGRLQRIHDAITPPNALNDAQQKALDSINDCFKQKNVTLLHGVTSAGKTEVYIHLITQALERGEQVLYMLPEIALTKQIVERLRRVFGNRIGLYHSKFSDAERVEIWKKQLSEQPYDIILGVRSSLFLPFRKLGLIIVDEEHENSYKQQEPAPRYNARNTAIVLASLFGAKTLLGTATPSIESYYNASTGKYGLVSLTARYRSLQMPEISIIDIKDLANRKQMTGPFSDPLTDAMKKALDNKKQIILFQNRRGYAPLLECRNCGWVPRCKHCDVSLTLHKNAGKLTCHYCGYTVPAPKICPNCEENNFVNLGYGTEKIEDELQNLFPEARIARMDLDTTRTRTSYENIINNFQQGKTDILIGTQMVSKGLDFDNVEVVGILNADTLLNYPDFRANERAYQLISQVAGRAGRKYGQGKVFLQTKQPDAPIMPHIIDNNYIQFYDSQLGERMLFHHPPFHRLVYVYLKHRDIHILEECSERMGLRMREIFGHRVLGPDLPPVARVQQLFIRKIVLKVENNLSQYKINEILIQLQQELIADKRYKAVTIYYDIDPL
ncbi:MAG: primosomal protein N' [Bacteroidaceae bacterium]|nr:primosomal protein N' [Bacteroidaceae bacterium]